MPISLEPLAAKHADALAGLMTPDEIAHAVDNPELFRFRAVLVDGACAGMVGLKSFPKKDPEIVVAIAEPHRGKGVATLATREMVRETFEQTGVKGVVLICEEGSPSNRVAEKAGFTFMDQFGTDRAHVLSRADWNAANAAEAAKPE
jgi:RimJ/RimL family protein N-acetyltransferase